jgi:phage terminase large subunit-like protein
MTCSHVARKTSITGRCAWCDPEVRLEAERLEEEVARARYVEQVQDAIESGDRAHAELGRRYLAAFVAGAWHVVDPDTPLEWSWHHDVWAAHIQYALDEWSWRRRHPLTDSVMQNLLANMPPGTGKSRFLSVMAPAWMWLDRPSWRVTCVSSNDAVVARDHEMMGKLIRSAWYNETYRPDWSIESDNARTGLVNTKGGVRLSRTYLAGAVGLRGDALFFDDIDDPARVKSAAYRAERDLKWGSAWYNRVNDDRVAVRITIQQRVDAQDHSALLLKGRIEQEEIEGAEETQIGPQDIAHLCLPLHWRPGLSLTPLQRAGLHLDPRTEEGQLLHPERFTARVITQLRQALGERAFDLQYDQRSSPKTAKIFQPQSWRFFQRTHHNDPRTHAEPLRRPKDCDQDVPARLLGQRSVLRSAGGVWIDDLDRVVISVDASFGAKRRKSDPADKTSRDGLGVMGALGVDRFVLADRTKPRTFPELKAAVKELCAEFPEASHLLIEERANGAALIQDLAVDEDFRRLGLVIEPIQPLESKVGRAQAHTPAIELGRVHLLDGASWLGPYISEHTKYEGRDGDASDRVDWTSQALRFLGGEGALPWWMSLGTPQEEAELLRLLGAR